MSDQKGTLRARGVESPPVPGGDDHASTSIGEYLKRQRQLRGITVEELAATTRIPLRSLERLEAGYFDGVSDGFVRGFVRTVAVALGLDADQTVARMLDEPVAGKWEDGGAEVGHKQLLAVGVLVAATALAFWVLRAGWNLLVGGSGSARSREVVVWRDPVHDLAREYAREQRSGRPTDARSSGESKTIGSATAAPDTAVEEAGQGGHSSEPW